MKKAKRFLTGLLSAALALSLCAMPAMADEDTTNVDTSKVNTPQKTTSVIDTTKEGSITITNIFTQKMGKRLLLQVKNRTHRITTVRFPAQVSRFIR